MSSVLPEQDSDERPSNSRLHVTFNEQISQSSRLVSKRKHTLAAVVDELTAHKKGSRNSIDERLQSEGAKAFFRFDSRIRLMLAALLSFESEIRPLASSPNVISSSHQLRSRLLQVVQLFRVNASAVFPSQVTKESPTESVFVAAEPGVKRVRIGEPGASSMISMNAPYPITSDLEDFPQQLARLAGDLDSLLDALQEIPDSKEAVSRLRTLGAGVNLRYWSSHLQEFKGHFGYPKVQRHVNDVMKEIDGDMENIENTLKLLHAGSDTQQGSRSPSSALQRTLAATADLDLSGKVTPLQRVAGGGYSDVWKGTMIKDEKETTVAIKELRIRTQEGALQRLKKRLFREISVWRKLNHPNVVPLLGYTMEPEGLPSMISPWYPWGNMVSYLQRNPSADRKPLVLDVARGLCYLHSLPLLHGDIKGENILVNEQGSASLCDFGMSKFIDDAQYITGFTTTNANIGGGTTRFLSPELLNDEPKSIKSDMWAFGCLLVQILTGQIPYRRFNSTAAINTAVIRGEPPYSIESMKSLDEALSDHIRQCWDTNPSVRPHAKELLEIIQSAFGAPTVIKSIANTPRSGSPTGILFETGTMDDRGNGRTDSVSTEGSDIPEEMRLFLEMSPTQSPLSRKMEYGSPSSDHEILGEGEEATLMQDSGDIPTLMLSEEPSEDTKDRELNTAFLYDTLMHPSALTKVLENDGSHLQVAPGLLRGYSRHRVVETKYPAVIPSSTCRAVFGNSLDEKDSVRGVIVDGLTATDLARIRERATSMYESRIVHVQPLSDFQPLVDGAYNAISDQYSALSAQQLPLMPARCEVWNLSLDKLQSGEWDYEIYVRNKWDEWQDECE